MPDPSPEERAAMVIAEKCDHFLSRPEDILAALKAEGLHITDQPAGDELHEAQMEAEHYREILERGDQITPEEAEAAASKLDFGGAIDGGLHWFEIADHAEVEAADRAEAKLRRLASLHPDGRPEEKD